MLVAAVPEVVQPAFNTEHFDQPSKRIVRASRFALRKR